MAVSQRSHCIVLWFTTGLIAVCISACASPSVADSEDGEDSDHWWTNSEIVADVIVGYLNIRASNKAVASDAVFGGDIINLLLLFDAWDDQMSLESLASLSSYYLGAHGGETYSCVVVRQGHAILPALEKQATATTGACGERFGEKKGICVPQKSRTSKLRTLIARINAGENCTVER